MIRKPFARFTSFSYAVLALLVAAGVDGQASTAQVPMFDPEAYNVECADGILGMEIIWRPELCGTRCRPPIADEVAAIESCLTETSGTAALKDTGLPASTETYSESANIDCSTCI